MTSPTLMGLSPVTPSCPKVRDLACWCTFEYKMAHGKMYMFGKILVKNLKVGAVGRLLRIYEDNIKMHIRGTKYENVGVFWLQ